MEDNIKKLNNDYKQMKKEASSREEKQHIKQDYMEMKGLLKDSNKLLKDAEQDQKKWNKVWDKLDKEYQKLGEPPKNDVNIEIKPEEQQERNKIDKDKMKDIDNLIKNIDKKIEELEKKESLEKEQIDYNKWKDEVLTRINNEEYQTIEEAKEQAKKIINRDNDLTSVWEKDGKYYVILSRDKEVAFRNNYKEVVKYDELREDSSNNINDLFTKDLDGKYIRLVIPPDFVKLILGSDKNEAMDLRGKKDSDLTTDEVIVLKKYAYELSEKEQLEKMLYKKNTTDIIWWVDNPDKVGEHLFTFDKKRIFNLFRDYPQELTPEQKELFDKENPYWADYFKDKN